MTSPRYSLPPDASELFKALTQPTDMYNITPDQVEMIRTQQQNYLTPHLAYNQRSAMQQMLQQQQQYKPQERFSLQATIQLQSQKMYQPIALDEEDFFYNFSYYIAGILIGYLIYKLIIHLW